MCEYSQSSLKWWFYTELTIINNYIIFNIIKRSKETLSKPTILNWTVLLLFNNQLIKK